MKKFLVLLAALLLPLGAWAQTVTPAQLMGLGMPAQLASRVGGICMPQTADGSDSSRLTFGGGGAYDATRGALFELQGNEHTGEGDAILQSGNDSNADILLRLNHASSSAQFLDQNGDLNWEFRADGSLVDNSTSDNTGGFIIFTRSGRTISLESGTAASACKGTGTFNGTTAVVINTTCAATGMHVSITPTSDPTGSTAAYCWVSAISNGVSFSVDCDQANDGTFSWVLIHESN